jgi:RimJ/RimL family protein N-acetyltransferase
VGREAHFRKNAFEKNGWRDSYLWAVLAEKWPGHAAAANPR